MDALASSSDKQGPHPLPWRSQPCFNFSADISQSEQRCWARAQGAMRGAGRGHPSMERPPRPQGQQGLPRPRAAASGVEGGCSGDRLYECGGCHNKRLQTRKQNTEMHALSPGPQAPSPGVGRAMLPLKPPSWPRPAPDGWQRRVPSQTRHSRFCLRCQVALSLCGSRFPSFSFFSNSFVLFICLFSIYFIANSIIAVSHSPFSPFSSLYPPPRSSPPNCPRPWAVHIYNNKTLSEP